MNKEKDEEGKSKKAIKRIGKSTTEIQYCNIIDILKGDKSDLDKIKVLILLEQSDAIILQDKSKLLCLFQVLSDCFKQNEFICSSLFKGQILITTTTLIIIYNIKDNYPSLFHNFINNILIEHLKNTSNQVNLYLRQIVCLCLEELEIEYPGLLFGLMGNRTLEIMETGRIIGNGSFIEDIKSVKSSRRSCYSAKESSYSGILKNIEHKKVELANEGLYCLIDEEKYFVFQYYLLLYTRILNHVIILYVEYGKSFSALTSPPSLKPNNTCLEVVKDNEEIYKEVDNNDLYHNLNIGAYNSNINNSIPSNQALNKGINNENTTVYMFSRLNYQVLSIQNDPNNTVLHINQSDYQNYIDLYEKTVTNAINTKNKDEGRSIKLSSLFHPQYHSDLITYINKALSYIIHLLPKTSEYIKVQIWQMISYIIANIEINQMALLPHFNYFHLNNSSHVLTLVIIPIITSFKLTLTSNFILKLVIKLCLLINDIRLNEALRILSIRWLLSMRSSFSFNFNKYLRTISYYLSPTPFDSLEIKNEKIKSLFIFFNSNNDYKGSEFIMKSLSIYDNYKYYPIFSKHVKSLFRTYLILVIRFPYEKVIKLLGEKITSNLKEIPRLLPNVINLLRNIKALSASCLNIQYDNESKDDNNNLNNQLQQMTSKEIYKCLLVDMSLFLTNYNSHSRLNNYFELFIELSKENSIDPSNLIKALQNLYASIKDLRNWKIEKNILEVCKYLLEYHNLDTIRKNFIQTLLNDIENNSFDYGIREQAKLYYELAQNVEKDLLVQFIKAEKTHHQYQKQQQREIAISYNYYDYEDSLMSILLLEQSKIERKESNLDDRGTAIYNCGSEHNKLFLSDYKTNDIKDNILIEEFNDNNNKGEGALFEKINDYSKREVNALMDKFISPDDILRLFVLNNQINVKKDALISEEKIFISEKDKDNTKENVNQYEINCDDNNRDLLKEYYQMISKTNFYIKLPLNISLKSSLNKLQIDKMYSISLCFGLVSHLRIKSKIIIPYLERCQSIDDANLYSFPYFYKTYLIIYPQFPIPTEIKARAIFFEETGKCCTGSIKTVQILFEDYFLPISIPQTYKDNQSQSEFKNSLFKSLWKQLKTLNEEYINTSHFFELTKDIMIRKVNKKIFPFLIDFNYEKQVFHIKNPYIDIKKKSDNEGKSDFIIKRIYNENKGEFTKLSYDFLMDNYLEMNLDKTQKKNDNGKYILAKAIIFLPDHYHILFKIKISDFSSIMEVRNDCNTILEYLDDYFDSWDN